MKRTTHLHEHLARELAIHPDDLVIETREDGAISFQYLDLRMASAFQPIFATDDDSILGHESLLRSRDLDGLRLPPNVAFDRAERRSELVGFDRLCRVLHVWNFQASDPGTALFVNVHPRLLVEVKEHGRVFERFLRFACLDPERVVIELLEGSFSEAESLADAVAAYRSMGCRIAIDDFGAKHSNLDRVWALRPEFVKLDPRIVREATIVPRGHAMLKKVIGIFHDLAAEVIVEGIETEVDETIARAAGADYLQGYQLCLPLARPLTTALSATASDRTLLATGS